MDLFSRFRKLDSSLQRGVDNSFARIFGGAVVPAEIDESLKDEATASIMRAENGTELAPSYYTVLLSPHDYEQLLGAHPNLPDDLSNRLARFVRNSGWYTNTPIQVELVENPELHTGQIKLQLSFQAPSAQDLVHESIAQQVDAGQAEPYSPLSDLVVAQVTPQGPGEHEAQETQEPQFNPQGARTSPGTEVFKQNNLGENAYVDDGLPDMPSGPVRGVILEVKTDSSKNMDLPVGTTTIGRSSSANLRLDDTGVSREHASITWDGYDAVLTDLDSTNGTTVNATPVDNWLLADGDVISLGHTDIAVHFH